MKMKHYCDEWIREWCEENGWTDLFLERGSNYWAFPPGAVIPEPIPPHVLRFIKSQKGFCGEEKSWIIAASTISLLSLLVSYLMKCPMPIVFAFAFDAITVAQLEVEDIGLDQEDYQQLDSIVYQSRNLYQWIGDCGDEY
jgi:hypothetical protein